MSMNLNLSLVLLSFGVICARASAEPQPGIQVAARQNLFDWGTLEGLEVLKQKLVTLRIPDVEKSFSFPIVGEFKLQLSNLHVAAFNASSDDARIAINEDHFSLNVDQIEVDLSFKWHWEKLGMSGTGQGELLLHGGSISVNFTVNNAPGPAHSFMQTAHAKDCGGTLPSGGVKGGSWSRRMAHAEDCHTQSLEAAVEQQGPIQHPHINVIGSSAVFDSVELSIKSYAADWLYQAVLTLFNDKIQRAVINGINSALQDDVPARINDILDTLPTRLDIQGLPLTASFQMALFTSTYVMVQGYGDIESNAAAARLATATDPSTLPPALTQARQLRASSARATAQQVQRVQAAGGSMAAATSAGTVGRSEPAVPAAGSGTGASVQAERCPFEATALPLGPPEVGSDPHMVSVYLHQSIINCVAWGLFRGGALQVSIVEGTVPNLHITTDLLAMLIPELPKAYPKQFMRIDVTALSPPEVSFSAAPAGSGTTTLVGAYRTAIYVANDTLGNPHIATLTANVTVQGQVAWDATIITSARVSHAVESSSMTVPAAQWDQTVAWFIQNYAGLFPLQSLVDQYVHTPVTSLVALINSHTTAYEGWVALSGDVVLRRQ